MNPHLECPKSLHLSQAEFLVFLGVCVGIRSITSQNHKISEIWLKRISIMDDMILIIIFIYFFNLNIWSLFVYSKVLSGLHFVCLTFHVWVWGCTLGNV